MIFDTEQYSTKSKLFLLCNSIDYKKVGDMFLFELKSDFAVFFLNEETMNTAFITSGKNIFSIDEFLIYVFSKDSIDAISERLDECSIPEDFKVPHPSGAISSDVAYACIFGLKSIDDKPKYPDFINDINNSFFSSRLGISLVDKKDNLLSIYTNDGLLKVPNTCSNFFIKKNSDNALILPNPLFFYEIEGAEFYEDYVLFFSDNSCSSQLLSLFNDFTREGVTLSSFTILDISPTKERTDFAYQYYLTQITGLAAFAKFSNNLFHLSFERPPNRFVACILIPSDKLKDFETSIPQFLAQLRKLLSKELNGFNDDIDLYLFEKVYGKIQYNLSENEIIPDYYEFSLSIFDNYIALKALSTILVSALKLPVDTEFEVI